MPEDSSAGSFESFIESLPLGQGGRAGENIVLAPWQRDFAQRLFTRRVSALSVPRGCGKTTLSAALAAGFLAGPQRVRGSDIAIVSGSQEQGRIAFRHLLSMLTPFVEASGGFSRSGEWESSRLVEPP